MKKIGKKQLEILEYIKKHLNNHGYPPTVREICKAVNLSSSATVHVHLQKLEDKGYIKRDSSISRGIIIHDDDREKNNLDIINVPIIGKVTAGIPIEAIENIIDYYPIPADKITNKKVFMLKVIGDSMINKGIYEDDLLLVNKQSHANNGEIVVALLNQNETTVKTFYKKEDHVLLQPENENYEPIKTQDVELIGKVIGLYREM